MYQIELVGEWSVDVPSPLRKHTEEIIAWKIHHKAVWYPQPGRTLVLNRAGYSLKIKGAGFYNPSNVSHAGTRRTTTPVPEGDVPMPPIQREFARDIIHIDPSPTPPHALESGHSIFAPIGGMTLAAAMHDQFMFSRLNTARLPANRLLASYKYDDLKLNEKPMGVSVSQLPEDVLPITAYHLYMVWNQMEVSPEALEFLRVYSGRGSQFSYENPTHRLEVLAKLASVAGRLLLQFSTKAGLYRFSGGPDNWSIKRDIAAPLYFSDVDTSQPLDAILPTQHGWEVLRNLISAIHNWFYYFLPCLTYEESGYTAHLLQQRSHDFVRAMLLGFFSDKDVDVVERVSQKIWRFFSLPLSAAEKETRIGLRTGEYLLQRFYPRPVFHLVMLSLLSELIQGSEFQCIFIGSDTSPSGIQRFVDLSVQHESHARMFPDYSPSKTHTLIAEIRADM